MGPEATFAILQETIKLLLAVSLPLLLVSLVVGVFISLIQAATQVQEASLVFVPKLLAVAGTFWIMAPWIGARLIDFVQEIFAAAATVGGGGLH